MFYVKNKIEQRVSSSKTYLKNPWKTNDIIDIWLRSNISVNILKKTKTR